MQNAEGQSKHQFPDRFHVPVAVCTNAWMIRENNPEFSSHLMIGKAKIDSKMVRAREGWWWFQLPIDKSSRKELTRPLYYTSNLTCTILTTSLSRPTWCCHLHHFFSNEGEGGVYS